MEEEKPSWQQRLHADFKKMDKRVALSVIAATTVYIGAILLMIILPIELIPSRPIGAGDGDPVVANNNNMLPPSCPLYTVIADGSGRPLSDGPLQLPLQRPEESCRTFTSAAMEKVITNITSRMVDKDLARLFENAYPNSLGIYPMYAHSDTTISWYDPDPSNPLTYVITGDIPAMWLRDSAHQFVPYLPLLPYDEGLRTLVLGLINLQAQHIADQPYCNAFQPPAASGLTQQSGPGNVHVTPAMDDTVYQCKWEIDSLASFLRLSWGYWNATNGDQAMITDLWLSAVQQIMTVLDQQRRPTLADDGSIEPQSYIYLATGSRAVRLSVVVLIADGSITVRRIRLSFCSERSSPVCLPSI
jgi:hypothetical protein